MNVRGRETTVDEILKMFLNYAKSKNFNKKTIRYYRNNFNKFIEFLKENEIKIIGQVNNQVVIGFILYLKDEMDNPKSINIILRAVRAVLYYVMNLNYIDNFKIKMLKTQDKIKETYTESINDIQWIEPEWKVDEEFQEQFEKRVFIGDKGNRYLEVPIKVRDPFQVGAKPSKYSQLYVRFNSHGSTWGKNSDGWRNMTLKFENLKVAGEHIESYRLYYPYIASEKFGLPEDTRYAIRPIMQNFKVKWE